MVSCSNNELMGQPYLELTNLDRILSEQSGNGDVGEQAARIIDQKQATDYLLVHSSKDHVAICPEMGNIKKEKSKEELLNRLIGQHMTNEANFRGHLRVDHNRF